MGVHRKNNNKKIHTYFLFSSCIIKNSSFFLSTTLRTNSSRKGNAPKKLSHFFIYLHSEWYARPKALLLEKNDLVERYDF